jgi:hypothetical protein
MVFFSKEQREFFAKFGRKGGKATARKLTKQERAESARRAAQARWEKAKAKKDAK